MHKHTLEDWQHQHDFAVVHEQGEKRTIQVLILTAITMIVEIVAGIAYGSMALLADGWHMSTHVAAFMIAIFAYRHARKYADSPVYTFGTGKVSVLGGFASAVALAVVALMMCMESIQRFFNPEPIHFNQAILVAIIGLLVNLTCAIVLQGHHEHNHHHDHDDHNHGHHDDHNLRAAYMHVLADAFTSVLAIAALLSGKYYGWNFLDPFMGIVGAIVITRWSYSLLKQTGPILLDESIGEEYIQEIVTKIENDSDNMVADIHVWKVGPEHYAAIISIVTHYPREIEHYQRLLAEFDSLSHVTIEINKCTGESCINQTLKSNA